MCTLNIVGKWITDDGYKFYFHEDGSFELEDQHLFLANFFKKNSVKIETTVADGKWSVVGINPSELHFSIAQFLIKTICECLDDYSIRIGFMDNIEIAPSDFSQANDIAKLTRF